MGPQRTPPRARAHVRSRYLKGVVPLIGGEIGAAAEVAVSKNEWGVGSEEQGEGSQEWRVVHGE